MTQLKPKSTHKSFEEVYAESIGLVQFVVSRFRFPIQIQEDLIQEVFLRYLEHEGTIGRESPKSFLVTVTRNLAIDYYRKQKRRHLAQHVPVEDVMHELLSLDGNERCQQLEAVADFLQSLKGDPQASTLLQYYDEDLSIKEIAARSHEPLATVSSRLSRQRSRYRARLEERLQDVMHPLCGS